MGVRWERDAIEFVGNQVYKRVNKNSSDIIDFHKKLNSTYGVSGNQNTDMKIPTLFAIPKLHKNPYKFRFIAGAQTSSLKGLSILLFRILAFFQKYFINYCRTLQSRTGKRAYWAINSSIQALEVIKRAYHQEKIKSLCTCDFSTLFTNLPHTEIKKCLFALTNLLFKNSKKDFISVQKTVICFSESKNDKGLYFTYQEILDMINVVIDETYVQFSNFIFKQTVGVLMGGNASPLIADLCLSWYEFMAIKESSLQEALTLRHCCRYMDDIIAINVDNFVNLATKIYPESLTLEETTQKDGSAPFLDLYISYKPNFKIRVYNKTDDFNFEVTRFIFADSNMHVNMGPKVFRSQVIRVARICNCLDDFEDRVTDMVMNLVAHGFDKNRLEFAFGKFLSDYKGLLRGMGITQDTDVAASIARIFYR